MDVLKPLVHLLMYRVCVQLNLQEPNVANEVESGGCSRFEAFSRLGPIVRTRRDAPYASVCFGIYAFTLEEHYGGGSGLDAGD